MTQVELSVEILSRGRLIGKGLVPISWIDISRIVRIFCRPGCCVRISICAHITSKNPRFLSSAKSTSNLIYSRHVLNPSGLLAYRLRKGIRSTINNISSLKTIRELRVEIRNKNILVSNTIKFRTEHIRKLGMADITFCRLIVINTRNEGSDSHNVTGAIYLNIKPSRIAIAQRRRTLITKVLISFANLGRSRSTNILKKNI